MTVTLKHWLMPLAPLGVGILLVYLHLTDVLPRPVWGMGGVFFISVAIGAWLLSLAWVLPGPLGQILRHPVSNILIILVIVIMLCVTVATGVIGQVR